MFTLRHQQSQWPNSLFPLDVPFGIIIPAIHKQQQVSSHTKVMDSKTYPLIHALITCYPL
jgi:hypothetical protein